MWGLITRGFQCRNIGSLASVFGWAFRKKEEKKNEWLTRFNLWGILRCSLAWLMHSNPEWQIREQMRWTVSVIRILLLLKCSRYPPYHHRTIFSSFLIMLMSKSSASVLPVHNKANFLINKLFKKFIKLLTNHVILLHLRLKYLRNVERGKKKGLLIDYGVCGTCMT